MKNYKGLIVREGTRGILQHMEAKKKYSFKYGSGLKRY